MLAGEGLVREQLGRCWWGLCGDLERKRFSELGVVSPSVKAKGSGSRR